MTNEQKFNSFIRYLDEILEYGSAPSFSNGSCEHHLSGDWLEMEHRGQYEKRVLEDYKKAVVSHYRKYKRTSWTPLRLKDFLDSRKRGRPTDLTDDYYQEIADLKAKGQSNREIIDWIRRTYRKRNNPSQDIKRAIKRHGTPQ